MRDDIVEYMRRSGLVPQSVEAMRKHVPRWERRLREMDIESVPRQPGEGPARAENMLNLLIHQSARMRNARVEHQLRNLTAIRPYKL